MPSCLHGLGHGVHVYILEHVHHFLLPLLGGGLFFGLLHNHCTRKSSGLLTLHLATELVTEPVVLVFFSESLCGVIAHVCGRAWVRV